ncbi:hypothetical protein C8R44DRAFT_820879 [Mycena epipterygia]|nr:hypothetical protein C8R44DRAFT_820879 [Mycena epipterygia]
MQHFIPVGIRCLPRAIDGRGYTCAASYTFYLLPVDRLRANQHHGGVFCTSPAVISGLIPDRHSLHRLTGPVLCEPYLLHINVRYKEAEAPHRVFPMDTTLRFAYSNPDEIRTFRAYERIDAAGGELELYQFYHSTYGPSSGVTTFQRQDLTTSVWEPAGEISWTSNSNATVHFGMDAVDIRDLRKPKKSSSQSRRFKAGGSEYKWKMSDRSNLFCVDARGKTVATWIHDETTLHVGAQAEHVLDRVVVTCLLNVWIRQLGLW